MEIYEKRSLADCFPSVHFSQNLTDFNAKYQHLPMFSFVFLFFLVQPVLTGFFIQSEFHSKTWNIKSLKVQIITPLYYQKSFFFFVFSVFFFAALRPPPCFYLLRTPPPTFYFFIILSYKAWPEQFWNIFFYTESLVFTFGTWFPALQLWNLSRWSFLSWGSNLTPAYFSILLGFLKLIYLSHNYRLSTPAVNGWQLLIGTR